MRKRKQSRCATFEIDGYVAVLPMVQNVYPVERDAGSWCWGFKYTTGIFEFFYCKTREKGEGQRKEFIAAVEGWHAMTILKPNAELRDRPLADGPA